MGGVPTAGLGALDLPPPLHAKPPSALGERRPARYDLHFQDTATRGTSHLSCCAANGPRALGVLSEWAMMIDRRCDSAHGASGRRQSLGQMGRDDG